MADSSNQDQRITTTVPIPGGSLTVDSSTPGSAIRERGHVHVAISEQLAHAALDDERRTLDFEAAVQTGTSTTSSVSGAPAHAHAMHAPATSGPGRAAAGSMAPLAAVPKPAGWDRPAPISGWDVSRDVQEYSPASGRPIVSQDPLLQYASAYCNTPRMCSKQKNQF